MLKEEEEELKRKVEQCKVRGTWGSLDVQGWQGLVLSPFHR